jgi:MYXO-CTERM domain-containing protein
MWFNSSGWAGRARLAIGCSFALVASATSAHAVLQPTPGGFTIPKLKADVADCSDRNVENCLDGSEGDAALIDAQADALVSPEVFQPTCSLTFKPITKGGGDHVAFGWYNIKEDPANAGQFLKPTQEELFGMMVLAQGNTKGAALAGKEAVLNLAAEAASGRYKGGAIGFFLAGDTDLTALKLDETTHALTGKTLTRVFYTQHALNPGSAGDKTYYQVLTWQSVKFVNSFYFGWEDRTASADADNDFDDLVFLVSGIQCTGGGEACDTGLEGVCTDGSQQCKKGKLECVQNIQASDETCNALDDDCNGEVDDGDGLCEVGKVCDRGRCVPKCGTGEFRCALDLVCTERGVCVEPACAKKDCPAGQVCRDGNCIDSCMGVVCPYGEVCRNGGCVDPCAGIECDEGYSCVLGVCRSCECSSCEGGQVCHQNVCVDAGCENQTCMAGSHCAMGACVDDCAGTVCPMGQLCSMGGCIVDPNAMSSGGSGGTDGSGGKIVIDPGKGASDTGGTGSTGSGDDGGSSSSGSGQMLSSGDDEQGDGGGCGCAVPGSGSHGGRAFAALALAGLLLLRRRR